MKWYWKVRCYRPQGDYYICELETERRLEQIDVIQDFYLAFTGCRMILEGMSEESFKIAPVSHAFQSMSKV